MSRQTQTFISERLKEAGVRPQGQHGQNFLIDLNLLDLLVRTANLGPKDVVLEVGTGLGSLTARMAQLAAGVVTVELDPRLFSLAAEELAGLANVTMLQQDALKNKNNIHVAVLEAVQHKLDAHPGSQFKLVANLPYNVATPVLSNLLTVPSVPVSLTGTIQKELADRIVAQPGRKDYSALSVWMQALCEIELVRELPPQVFWPRPKVQSAIVHIVPSPAKRAVAGDLAFLHAFVRRLFCHRRKFLRSVLVNEYREQLGKTEIDELLAPFAFATDARAEQLDVLTLVELAKAVKARMVDSTTQARREG
jgi:16S rRNA (adenine1518-N6/adenine1519-N6)-dimethyltransferase